jgi:hypothetical protein
MKTIINQANKTVKYKNYNTKRKKALEINKVH